MKKKRSLSETFLELCEKSGIFELSDLRIHKILNQEYYQVIKQEIEDKELRRSIYQQIQHLKNFNYFNKNGLSKKGIIKYLILKNKQDFNKGVWDKKWRIIIFDIPEKKRKVRDRFRSAIIEIGFKMLQRSIWISPKGNFEDIQQIIREYKIEKYVVLIFADRISNDLIFEKKFNIE